MDTELAGAPDELHVGSVATVLEPGASDVARLLEASRAAATITFDLNIRPALIYDAVAARSRAEQFVRLADVAKVSDEDLFWVHPDRDLAETAAFRLAAGPAVLVVTQGEEGAFALTSQDGCVRA